MAYKNVSCGSRRVQVDELQPDAQTSANDYAALDGSEADARPWTSISYNIKVATNTISWKVQGANSADFSDAVEVQAEADVLANGVATYAASQAVYAHYRVMIKSKVAATHGEVTLYGILK